MLSSQVVSYIKLRNETDGLVLSAPGSRYILKKYEDNANSNFGLVFLICLPCLAFPSVFNFGKDFKFY